MIINEHGTVPRARLLAFHLLRLDEISEDQGGMTSSEWDVACFSGGTPWGRVGEDSWSI